MVMPGRRLLGCVAAVSWSLCSVALGQDQAPAPAAEAAPAPAPAPEPAPAAAPAVPGSIQGTVKSQPWAESLPEAEATLSGTQLKAVSNAEGKFEIKGVPPGDYQLTVAFPGHKTAVIPVTVKPGEAAVVAAGLSMEEIRGEEIVVVGSKFPEKRLESPVTVEVVRPQEVEMMGSSSYLAALSQVKGVDYTDNGVGEKRISARGFNTQFNSRMLFMVDGRLATLPGNGLPQGALLPTSSLDIHGVEVVVGPAAALYGPNAHTGVVNVVTKTPWDETGAQVALRGGSQSVLDGSARVAVTVNQNLGFKLTGQLMRGKDWAPVPGQTAASSFIYGTAAVPVFEADLIDDRYDISSGKAEGFAYYRAGDWNVKAGGGWSINTGFSATNTGRNHLRGWQVNYQTVQVSSSHWYAQVSRTFSNAGQTYQMDALAARVARSGGLPDQATLDQWRLEGKFVDKSTLWDSELQYRNEWGALKVIAGAQGRLYQPVSEGTYLADVNGTKLSAREAGVYAQADYTLLPDRLKAVAAVRLDTHTDYSPQVSPKAALVYTLVPGQNVRFGYNRAFKSPTILENYLLINGSLLGNKTGFRVKDVNGNVLSEIAPLSPEQVDSLEAGYKGSVAERVFVDLVGYHSWYKDFISPLSARANPAPANPLTPRTFGYYATTDELTPGNALVPAGALSTYSNFGSAQVLGVDLGVDYQVIPEMALNGSVSYIRMYSFQNNDATLRNLLLNVPQFKARGGVTFQDFGIRNSFLRLTGRWQSAYQFASGRWISQTFFPGDGKIPARFVADIAFGYEFENGLKLSGNVFNMLDDHGVDVLGAPAAGRFGFIQLEYSYDGLNF